MVWHAWSAHQLMYQLNSTGRQEAWSNPLRNGLNCSTAFLCPNQTESAERSRDLTKHLVSNGACRLFHGGDGWLMSCQQCLCLRLSKHGLQLQIPYARDTLPSMQSAWVEHSSPLLSASLLLC